MKFQKEFTVGLRDLGMSNELTNYGFLSYLEDIGTIHSDHVGYGVKDIFTKHRAWILLDWKLNVIQRPSFGEKVLVRTWATNIEKSTYHVYRNFEVFNEKNELIATATSRWVLFDTENMKITKVDMSFIEMYKPEGTEQEAMDQLKKLEEPSYFNSIQEYKVKRSDIDVNHHMHNLNYLKVAYEALPENIYFGKECNNLNIMYKRQIKFGDKVKCYYSYEDKSHYVTIKSEDDKILHAIIKLSD